MINKEDFCLAITSIKEQVSKDKTNSTLLQEVFSINEEFIYDNSLLIKQIINLLSIWFDKEDLEHYCFDLNFGKQSIDGDFETVEQFYDRLTKNIK